MESFYSCPRNQRRTTPLHLNFQPNATLAISHGDTQHIFPLFRLDEKKKKTDSLRAFAQITFYIVVYIVLYTSSASASQGGACF